MTRMAIARARRDVHRATGHRWELLARDIKVNRAGAAPGHSLADAPTKVKDVALTHDRAYAWVT